MLYPAELRAQELGLYQKLRLASVLLLRCVVPYEIRNQQTGSTLFMRNVVIIGSGPAGSDRRDL